MLGSITDPAETGVSNLASECITTTLEGNGPTVNRRKFCREHVGKLGSVDVGDVDDVLWPIQHCEQCVCLDIKVFAGSSCRDGLQAKSTVDPEIRAGTHRQDSICFSEILLQLVMPSKHAFGLAKVARERLAQRFEL